MTTTSTDDRAALGQALADALDSVLTAFYASGGDADLLGEVLVGAGVLVQPTDSVGALVWLHDGEPFTADEYDPDRPADAVPLFQIGAPS